MIESTRYPYLQIRVHTQAFSGDAAALVDTGFDGYVIVPRSLYSALGPPVFAELVGVASGDVFLAPGYLGTVQLIGLDRDIVSRILLIGDEYVLGRAVLDRYRVTFDRGARVIVEA